MNEELLSELQALRCRKANVKPREIDALLTRLGCTRRSGKGDHWIFSHPTMPFPLTIDPRRPTLLPVYVTKVIQYATAVIEHEH
jgi:predicted RNA binding protein YcfA (HicA-like mRNA interferase family)